MGQHVLFLVLTPLLLATAVQGIRARAQGQDIEVQALGRGSHSITEERCGAVVSEVQKSKSYTEESIRPICDREIKSTRCDFFAEALSLASSHADFNGKGFCGSIVSAQFCAQTMDRLLTSQAMADLARGDCNREPNSKGTAYCEKFQNMLAYSVQNDDLDTMRACYMMEAYQELGTPGNSTNKTEGAAHNATLQPSKDRIISSSAKELDPMNEEHATSSTEASQKSTPSGGDNVVKTASAEREVNKGNASAEREVNKGNGSEIVVEPVPAEREGNQGNGSEIVTDPEPAQSKGNSTIATDPVYIPDKNAEVPSTQEEAEELKPMGSEVNSQPAATQPAATVSTAVNTQPAATVSTAVSNSRQIPEVRLNIGGPSTLISTKAKAIIASKVRKSNASQNSQARGSKTSLKVIVSNASASSANTTL